MTGNLDIIVAGGGRVGRKTAELLLEYGHAPVLVDHDEGVVKALQKNTTQDRKSVV